MRTKMTISNRAKIFAPFDALKGFKEALREKEKVIIEKKELTEDEINDLNEKISQIKIHNLIKVLYYDNDNQSYVEKIGIITKINTTLEFIRIVKDDIYFNDLKSIEIIKEEGI